MIDHVIDDFYPKVLEAIVDRLPPPMTHHGRESEFRGRIVDSWFDEHRGVVCLVQVRLFVLFIMSR